MIKNLKDVNATMKATLFYPYKKKIPDISEIKITKEAFQKMNLYASIVSEVIGSDKECLGTLLNYKGMNDNAVRDIHLWKGQIVTSSDGWPGDTMDDYLEAKNRGMKVIGLWHSHGLNHVFHSSYDEKVLNQMYGHIKNKVVTGEKDKNIECIVEGETIRLFEEGSNKEIRIKGKIEDIRYIERDECRVLNSIVVNKNSYSREFTNPGLDRDYDAEVWAGYEKNDYKRFKNIRLKFLDETNNIQLDEECLVKEVGEKVKFQGSYLKDLPDYLKVLEKYKKIKEDKTISTTEKIVEIPEDSKTLEGIIPRTASRIICKGYYRQVYDFYSDKKFDNNEIVSAIGLLGEIFSGDYREDGKRYWFWKDRIEKSEQVYEKIRGKECEEQRAMLKDLLKILNTHYYAKKKYGKKISSLCEKMGLKDAVKIKKCKKGSGGKDESKRS